MRINRSKIIRIIYPYRCELCGEIVPIEKEYCSCAFEKIIRVSKNFCDSCGHDTDKCVCDASKIKLPHITAPFIYSGFIKKYILNYKFHGKKNYYKKLGKQMAERFNACYPDVSADLVTYVPVSADTLVKRGYNQSKLLAKEVSDDMHLPLICTLDKVKETIPQSKLGINERNINLKDAIIAVKNVDLTGKTVILCDDIKTTGNTLSVCVRLLLDMGAEDVYCLCAALSDYERLPF